VITCGETLLGDLLVVRAVLAVCSAYNGLRKPQQPSFFTREQLLVFTTDSAVFVAE